MFLIASKPNTLKKVPKQDHMPSKNFLEIREFLGSTLEVTTIGVTRRIDGKDNFYHADALPKQADRRTGMSDPLDKTRNTSETRVDGYQGD